MSFEVAAAHRNTKFGGSCNSEGETHPIRNVGHTPPSLGQGWRHGCNHYPSQASQFGESCTKTSCFYRTSQLSDWQSPLKNPWHGGRAHSDRPDQVSDVSKLPARPCARAGEDVCPFRLPSACKSKNFCGITFPGYMTFFLEGGKDRGRSCSRDRGAKQSLASDPVHFASILVEGHSSSGSRATLTGRPNPENREIHFCL